MNDEIDIQFYDMLSDIIDINKYILNLARSNKDILTTVIDKISTAYDLTSTEINDSLNELNVNYTDYSTSKEYLLNELTNLTQELKEKQTSIDKNITSGNSAISEIVNISLNNKAKLKYINDNVDFDELFPASANSEYLDISSKLCAGISYVDSIDNLYENNTDSMIKKIDAENKLNNLSAKYKRISYYGTDKLIEDKKLSSVLESKFGIPLTYYSSIPDNPTNGDVIYNDDCIKIYYESKWLIQTKSINNSYVQNTIDTLNDNSISGVNAISSLLDEYKLNCDTISSLVNNRKSVIANTSMPYLKMDNNLEIDFTKETIQIAKVFSTSDILITNIIPPSNSANNTITEIELHIPIKLIITSANIQLNSTLTNATICKNIVNDDFFENIQPEDVNVVVLKCRCINNNSNIFYHIVYDHIYVASENNFS